MANIETSRPMVDGHRFGVRLTNMFTGLVATVSAWNDARVTRNALSKLSDHELDDLGLSRGDIASISAGFRG